MSIKVNILAQIDGDQILRALAPSRSERRGHWDLVRDHSPGREDQLHHRTGRHRRASVPRISGEAGNLLRVGRGRSSRVRKQAHPCTTSSAKKLECRRLFRPSGRGGLPERNLYQPVCQSNRSGE
jgi:hypothetical protein